MKIHHWFVALVLFVVTFAAIPDNYFIWSAAWDEPLQEAEPPLSDPPRRVTDMHEQTDGSATQGLIRNDDPPGWERVSPWPMLSLDDVMAVGLNEVDHE